MFFKRRPKIELIPEWMIVGLGNPGGEYSGTRHNVGFETIDRLAVKHKIKLDRSKHRARYGMGMVDETTVVLVKPLTYMNLSGQAVAPMARDWSIPAERVLVVADDMDLETGAVKLRRKGSAGGHNGHKSLIQFLHSQEYPRIKIGIGKKGQAIEHVLSRFTPEERSPIDEAIQKAVSTCELLLEQGLERAMEATNGREREV